MERSRNGAPEGLSTAKMASLDDLVFNLQKYTPPLYPDLSKVNWQDVLSKLPPGSSLAQTRLGRNPMMILPDKDYAQFAPPDAEAFTSGQEVPFLAKMRRIVDYLRPESQAWRQADMLGERSPIVTAPRSVAARKVSRPISGDVISRNPNPDYIGHEAIHAFMEPVDRQVDWHQVLNLLSEEGKRNMMKNYGYSPQDTAREIPARAVTEPSSLIMSTNEGRALLSKYLEIARKYDPARAQRMAHYFGLAGSEKGDGVASLQRPNDVY